MQAQLELQKVLYTQGITKIDFPDLSTKEKAQEYIGIGIKERKEQKENWKKNTLPKWIEKAKQEGKLIAHK